MNSYATPDSFDHRKYHEPHRPEISGFQEDRRRILRCSAFRRLDYKTQVFVPHEHDMYRTRMTHTLEVAQITRNISRTLDLNEDLTEAVALAHDLGHPPFGHAGEKILDSLMKDHGRFEHNRQSLRVVDYLEHPYPSFRGLNLTDVTRECIARHETTYDTPSTDEFDPSLSPPLEGQVCDIADEIAYTVADLEDGLASEWISEQQVSSLGLWQKAYYLAGQEYQRAKKIHKRIAATRNVARILIKDLVSKTQKNIAKFKLKTPEDAGKAARCVVLSPVTDGMFEKAKEFLLKNLYMHPDNIHENRQSEKILRALFNSLTQNPLLLPERYRNRIDRPGENGRTEGTHRIVCDYIAGMTDRFARLEYSRVTGNRATG